MPAPGANRGLTHESFERLLSALDSDRAAAGEKYERLRIRLVRFFAWEGGTVPEDLADEALTRTATRLSQGEPIRDMTHYLLGVARLLIKEDRKKRLAAERAMAHLAQVPRVSPPGEGISQCLDQCLTRLSVENRTLILRYYDGDKGNRIENRKKIAAELGLEINALRNRALRLREKLEECVRNCASDRGRDVSRNSDTSG